MHLVVAMARSHRLILSAAMMLTALLGASSLAKDSDFAANELNRLARSKLSHLSSGQRQAINMAERYRAQKQAQLRAKANVVPSATPANAATSPDVQGYEKGRSFEPRVSNEVLVSYSLTDEDCEQMLSQVVESSHPKGTILAAQKQLVSLGFLLAKVDDKLGEETKKKLNQYCLSARFALANLLLDMLQIHASIHKVHPDWIRILASRDFAAWATEQQDYEEIGKTRQLGNADEVIKLLDRYKTRRPAVVIGDDFHVSYSLTKDDFVQLRSMAGISKLIEGLQDQLFSSKKAFDAGLEAAFKDVPNPERYMQLVQKYAELQTGLMLTEQSFKNLKVKQIPEHILDAVQSLQDLNYPDAEINTAVEEAVNKLGERLKDYKPDEIAKLAKATPKGVQITDESLDQFSKSLKKEDPFGPVLTERLSKMRGVDFSNPGALVAAITKVFTQLDDELTNSIPAIVGETEEVVGYSVSEDSMQEINEQLKTFIVPEIYLELLSYMQDVEFPDQELFWMAAKSRLTVAGTNNLLRRSILGVIEKYKVDKVDKQFLARLREEKVAPSIILQFGSLENRKFDDPKALIDEVRKQFSQLNERFDVYRPLVVAQAKKKYVYDKTKRIQWSGESCNCVHDSLAGIVYGFYPYWKAGEKQVIDFSVLTRIGYYGLGFDDRGNVIDASRWADQDTSFIREAHTYNTKVDLVISRSDWNTWGQFSLEEKTAIFDNLAANLAELVNIPLADPISRAKPLITLGTSTRPVMGDGVTLYFKGYPQDKDSLAAFKSFTRSLRDLLRAQKRKVFLNMMFSTPEMGKGIHDYPKLREFKESIEGEDPNLDTLFLVLVEEPVSDKKKQLRIAIENEYHGEHRVRMLRNLVLVRSVDGSNERQIVDDVIYAKDSFGGIGFWPQAFGVAGNAGDNVISRAVKGSYVTKTDVESSVNVVICRYACPNRLAFRVAWEVLVLLLIACVFVYFRRCESRATIEKYFIHIMIGLVAPTFLLSISLLYCDPFLSQHVPAEALIIFAIIAVIGYSVWSHQNKLKKVNLP